MSSRDFRLLSHEAMDFIRTKIAVNLLNTCICDHNDIDQDDDSVNLVNQISDMKSWRIMVVMIRSCNWKFLRSS